MHFNKLNNLYNIILDFHSFRLINMLCYIITLMQNLKKRLFMTKLLIILTTILFAHFKAFAQKQKV